MSTIFHKFFTFIVSGKIFKACDREGKVHGVCESPTGPKMSLSLSYFSREALVVSPCLILVKHSYMLSFSHLTSLYGIRLSFLEFLGAFIAVKVSPLFDLQISSHLSFTLHLQGPSILYVNLLICLIVIPVSDSPCTCSMFLALSFSMQWQLIDMPILGYTSN